MELIWLLRRPSAAACTPKPSTIPHLEEPSITRASYVDPQWRRRIGGPTYHLWTGQNSAPSPTQRRLKC